MTDILACPACSASADGHGVSALWPACQQPPPGLMSTEFDCDVGLDADIDDADADAAATRDAPSANAKSSQRAPAARLPPLHFPAAAIAVTDVLVTTTLSLPHRLVGIRRLGFIESELRHPLRVDDGAVVDAAARASPAPGIDLSSRETVEVILNSVVSESGFYSVAFDADSVGAPASVVVKAYRPSPRSAKVSAELRWHRELFVLANLAKTLSQEQSNHNRPPPFARCLGYAMLKREKKNLVTRYQPILVLEHAGVSASTLEERFQRDSPLLRSVLRCLFDAVSLASRCGFSHGDISLKNLLIRGVDTLHPIAVLADWNSAAPMLDERGFIVTDGISLADIRGIARIARQAVLRKENVREQQLAAPHLQGFCDVLNDDAGAPGDRFTCALNAFEQWPPLLSDLESPLASRSDISTDTGPDGTSILGKRRCQQ